MTRRAVGTIAPRVQLGSSGRGQIPGTTKNKATPANVPVSRRVLLHDQATAVPIREKWSDPGTGAYVFQGVPEGRKHYVVAFDHTGEWGGEVETDIFAEPMP